MSDHLTTAQLEAAYNYAMSQAVRTKLGSGLHARLARVVWREMMTEITGGANRLEAHGMDPLRSKPDQHVAFPSTLSGLEQRVTGAWSRIEAFAKNNGFQGRYGTVLSQKLDSFTEELMGAVGGGILESLNLSDACTDEEPLFVHEFEAAFHYTMRDEFVEHFYYNDVFNRALSDPQIDRYVPVMRSAVTGSYSVRLSKPPIELPYTHEDLRCRLERSVFDIAEDYKREMNLDDEDYRVERLRKEMNGLSDQVLRAARLDVNNPAVAVFLEAVFGS